MLMLEWLGWVVGEMVGLGYLWWSLPLEQFDTPKCVIKYSSVSIRDPAAHPTSSQRPAMHSFVLC